MRNENMSKSLLIAYYIKKILSPLVGNRGRWTRWWRQFQTGCRINAISAHAH